MRTHVLFIQGGGAGTHDEWDNKLVASLERELGNGYEIRYPRMPDEADPSYAAWRPALLDELARLGDGAIVVGHSVGGTILLHALAEQPPTRALGGVLLIATPFVGEGGWPSDEIETRADLSACLPRETPIILYHGTDDDSVPVAHADLYARAIPHATVRRLAERNHQLDDDMREVAADIRRLTAEAPRRTPRA